jgi:nucleoside-diphosphate-sugar epimerase
MRLSGSQQWRQTTTLTMFMFAGGTRFIGLYLARQLIEAGHEVTLFTRGKKQVCATGKPASFISLADGGSCKINTSIACMIN